MRKNKVFVIDTVVCSSGIPMRFSPSEPEAIESRRSILYRPSLSSKLPLSAEARVDWYLWYEVGAVRGRLAQCGCGSTASRRLDIEAAHRIVTAVLMLSVLRDRLWLMVSTT